MAVPIPQRPSGYRLGNPGSPVEVEVFFDLECPFSKRGWQRVMQVAEACGPDRLYLILQPMTLGNHRQSWDATKAAIALAGSDPKKFTDIVSYIFSRQEEFANEAWKDKTQTDFHQLLADFAAAATDFTDREAFLDQLNSKEVYARARIPARFAIVRGVWSTPTFFINGAEATGLSSGSSLEDWQAVLEPLF